MSKVRSIGERCLVPKCGKLTTNTSNGFPICEKCMELGIQGKLDIVEIMNNPTTQAYFDRKVKLPSPAIVEYEPAHMTPDGGPFPNHPRITQAEIDARTTEYVKQELRRALIVAVAGSLARGVQLSQACAEEAVSFTNKIVELLYPPTPAPVTPPTPTSMPIRLPHKGTRK